jgi:hypothetical protein
MFVRADVSIASEVAALIRAEVAVWTVRTTMLESAAPAFSPTSIRTSSGIAASQSTPQASGDD